MQIPLLLLSALLISSSSSAQEVLIDEFTVNCSPLTIQRSDPIVSPGVASGHVHAITGGTAFKRRMGSTDAVNARATTCDKILDKSNYWQPQLYHIRSDGKYEMVKFQGNLVMTFPGGSIARSDEFPRAPPADLRIVSGDPFLRTYNQSNIAQRAISHMCLTQGSSYETPGLPSRNCLRLRAQVTMPGCWDGKNLDSADHKSHMAFPAIGDYNGGVCPQSHPVAIMQLFLEFFYDTSPYGDHKFVYAMGDVTGYGLHGDFVNGWTDLGRLGNALRTCTGRQGVNDPNCSLNVDGKGGGSSSNQNPETPATYEEEIGLNGPVSKLPGNNPVTGTPQKRSRVFSA